MLLWALMGLTGTEGLWLWVWACGSHPSVDRRLEGLENRIKNQGVDLDAEKEDQ